MGIKLSGSGSEGKNGSRYYTRLGFETGIWTNTRSASSLDENGLTKPYALRIIGESV